MAEGWVTATVSELAQVKGGKRLPAGFSLQDAPTPHPYVRVVDMYNGGVRESDLRFVPVAAASQIRAYCVGSDDIFVSVAGTLGIVGRVPESLHGANLTENADCLTNIKCDVDYLMYYMLSEPIQNEIDSIRTVGAQPKLALGRIKSLEVKLPVSRAGQARISGALRDIDELIRRGERLIAKKRALKQGTMQQLLTGSTRLPGFSNPWSCRTSLSEVTRRFSGYWGRDEGAAEVDVRVIRAGDVGSQNRIFGHATRGFTRDEAERARCEIDDVVLTTSGTVGNVALIAEDGYFASNFVRVLRPPRGLVGAYLYYLLQSRQAKMAMNLHLGISAMPNLSSSFFRDAWMVLPEHGEQLAIASGLADFDREIFALERRLKAAHAVKQGMMQELLTGRTRLGVEEDLS